MAKQEKAVGSGKTFDEAVQSAVRMALGGSQDRRIKWSLQRVTGEAGRNFAGVGEDVINVEITVTD